MLSVEDAKNLEDLFKIKSAIMSKKLEDVGGLNGVMEILDLSLDARKHEDYKKLGFSIGLSGRIKKVIINKRNFNNNKYGNFNNNFNNMPNMNMNPMLMNQMMMMNQL